MNTGGFLRNGVYTIGLLHSPSYVETLYSHKKRVYELTTPKVYNYSNIDHTVLEVIETEHRKEKNDCAEVNIVRLKNTTVNPNGSLIDETGTAIEQTVHDFAKTMTFETTEHIEPANFRGIVLFKYGFNNYGHWLIEMLPKLHFLKPVLNRYPDAKFLVGKLEGGMRNVVLSSLEVFGIKSDRIHQVHESTQFDELIYCSPITNHPTMMRPEIRSIYDSNFPCIAPASNTNTRLYITRSKNSSRVLRDQHNIERHFSREGYAVIDPGSLSLLQQIRLFRTASEVVGIAGAGMTNTIFAPSTCRILHIVPPTMPNLFFYQLASICRQSYNEFRGDTDGGMFGKEFTIDFDQLREAMEDFSATVSN